MNLESITGIRHGLQDCRRDGLTQFFNEFMTVLIAEGYTFEDLLDAITSWVALNPELEDVVKHLEDAEQKMRLFRSQSSV
ncbi:hypothetical protein VF14_02995 [Nostoc linckia z18]|uniref:Uncharacterized protein n=2 Tax=Nostoc linckia TaxID=92942 RepID=A0A9Q5ZH97_NOSLI|nr:hypothetical protein [Nostoc linckia]PHK42350.1 hypothetical protein VF12_03010 [Nostoc linckia z15]PHK46791.1 hypothetical protein VF13_08880 [Nostoc linckia z16]PHJ69120.1 hypothetical protein VF02_00465 [Nostoc linckia z1]PHJ73271.1 hypothetical protein VF05_01480 [Nostoc linckia z3]PHJ78618.1 hypothetical protein VF03_00465 [Nostoc linckia z2]